MASPPHFLSRVAPSALPTPGGSLVSATVAVSTPPTLGTDLPFEAVAGTSPAHAIVASPFQAVSSPTRAVEFVVKCSGCKRSLDEERSSSAKQLRGGRELLRTGLVISPIRGLAAPPVQRAARGGRETIIVGFFPTVVYIISISRMLVSV